MATNTVLIPNVELSLEQLIAAIRQLEPDARSRVAQALLADDMDARFAALIARLANKQPVTAISDADIEAEIRAVRQQQHS